MDHKGRKKLYWFVRQLVCLTCLCMFTFQSRITKLGMGKDNIINDEEFTVFFILQF